MQMRIEELKAGGANDLIEAATAVGGFSFEALPWLDVIANANMEQQAASPITGGGMPRIMMPSTGGTTAKPSTTSQQPATSRPQQPAAASPNIPMAAPLYGAPGYVGTKESAAPIPPGELLQNQSAGETMYLMA